MEQRTCNIIMCCKGHCELEGAGKTSLEAIAAYMSKECACPKEDYKGQLMESILRTAMFDFFSCADKPDVELRHLFYQYATHEPSLSERICTMFQLTQVRNSDGSYANGFSDKLLAQSEKDIGGVTNEHDCRMEHTALHRQRRDWIFSYLGALFQTSPRKSSGRRRTRWCIQ